MQRGACGVETRGQWEGPQPSRDNEQSLNTWGLVYGFPAFRVTNRGGESRVFQAHWTADSLNRQARTHPAF